MRSNNQQVRPLPPSPFFIFPRNKKMPIWQG
jgi:hypothetical protein